MTGLRDGPRKPLFQPFKPAANTAPALSLSTPLLDTPQPGQMTAPARGPILDGHAEAFPNHPKPPSRRGPRTAVRPGGACHLPQCRERLLCAAGQGARPQGAGHPGRTRRLRLCRRICPGLRPLGAAPRARPPVPRRLFARHAADHAGGHREVSGLRPDQRHRPGLRQEAGEDLRRAGVRRHRNRAAAPDRGARDRPEAHHHHHPGLGRAEDRPGDHGLPPAPRRRHLACRAHLQDLWRRRHPAGDGEPLPAGPRHPRAALVSRPPTPSPSGWAFPRIR